MPKERLIMTLAKVLIAAAWADGELTHEEVNSMKDLLWRLPQLSARDWASLQIYIDSPVGGAERARLVSELQQAIRTSRDRDLVLATVEDLMHADGEVSEAEEQVAGEIREPELYAISSQHSMRSNWTSATCFSQISIAIKV